MKLYAKERGFIFPYLYDGATQATAKAYGCLCTPHMFLFDRSGGSATRAASTIPSGPTRPPCIRRTARTRWRPSLRGAPCRSNSRGPMGCSTKWLTKRGAVAEGNEAWKNMPVSIEPVDAAGIAALARNPTDRLRVINLWATWCVPCVEEFPGLVSISRRLETATST
jgi:hypothetical protein